MNYACDDLDWNFTRIGKGFLRSSKLVTFHGNLANEKQEDMGAVILPDQETPDVHLKSTLQHIFPPRFVF